MNRIRNFCAAMFVALASVSAAQENERKFPPTFFISASELSSVLTRAEGSVLDMPANPFLHQSRVEMNTLNGDMRFLRIKSDYFKGALLTIQVNGPHSTQVFVMSDFGGIYYRGAASAEGVKMEKCEKDDIVVE